MKLEVVSVILGTFPIEIQALRSSTPFPLLPLDPYLNGVRGLMSYAMMCCLFQEDVLYGVQAREKCESLHHLMECSFLSE